MGQILLKSASFLFLITLGYILKIKGIFGPHDYKIISKIVLNVTMPCAVLVSFASYQPDMSLLLIIILSFGANCLMFLVGSFLGRKQPRSTRAVWMNCTPSFNIGAFVMPFVQSFLSPASLVSTCLFDLGNALMCNGTTYALSCNFLDGTKGLNVKRILKTLSSSVPFLAYTVMLVITMFKIPVPQQVVSFVTPMANANAFLAMFMVGMMLDLRIEKSLLKEVAGILLIRFVFAVSAALAFYFLLPLPLAIRQALAVTVFAPISMTTTALTPHAGGDPAVTACASSCSILICIPSVLILLTTFGVL